MNKDSKPHNYRLDIAYDGTDYSGWQIQPNTVTIQELIQSAIRKVLQEEINLIGSGRTDAGVHALGQVAHFRSEQEIDPKRLHHSLNGILPKAIRILDLQKVDPTFHSQRSAKSKIYHYHLHLCPVKDPFKRHYSLAIYNTIDLDKLQAAGKQLVGTHNFTSFANSSTEGSVAKNPIRTIYRIDLVPEEGGVRLEFEGNGFFYKMIRNIVGTLLEVASGKREVDEIPKLLAMKDRRKVGRAAAPHALFLVSVKYEEP